MVINNYAKIGYEAYRTASGGITFDGRPMPTWDELATLPDGACTRGLWVAASQAVVMAAASAVGAELNGFTKTESWALVGLSNGAHTVPRQVITRLARFIDWSKEPYVRHRFGVKVGHR